jgi:hypothetical protein
VRSGVLSEQGQVWPVLAIAQRTECLSNYRLVPEFQPKVRNRSGCGRGGPGSSPLTSSPPGLRVQLGPDPPPLHPTRPAERAQLQGSGRPLGGRLLCAAPSCAPWRSGPARAIGRRRLQQIRAWCPSGCRFVAPARARSLTEIGAPLVPSSPLRCVQELPGSRGFEAMLSAAAMPTQVDAGRWSSRLAQSLRLRHDAPACG